MPVRIIAIMNQKGGVGKTTTAINLGAALAERGKRTLLVDLDPQANLTRGLGLSHEEVAAGKSIYDVMTDHKVDLGQAVRRTRWEHLDVVPSHIDLSGAEIEMVATIGRELRLKRAMGELPAGYDYIIIDCLPSLSLITVNACAAATEVFVPMQAHPFALEGLGKLFEVLDLVKAEINPALDLTGVVVTMFDPRTNISREVMDKLSAHPRLGGKLFKTVVRQNIRIAESQGAGMPVIHFDKSCHGAEAYRALAAEVEGAGTEPQPSSKPEAESGPAGPPPASAGAASPPLG